MNDRGILKYREVLIALQSYCAYRERCTSEVLTKLEKLGYSGDQAERVVVELRKNKFLDDERYAASYAGSKFKYSGWGRKKIRQAMKLKGLPDEIIYKALEEEIDPDAYYEKLKEIIRKKQATLKDRESWKKKQKVMAHAASKGYEPDLIRMACEEEL